MRFPATSASDVIQERVALPSITTVQAPHSPSPQPYLQPASSKSSRRTLSRLRLGSAATSRDWPLISRRVIAGIDHSPVSRDQTGPGDLRLMVTCSTPGAGLL